MSVNTSHVAGFGTCVWGCSFCRIQDIWVRQSCGECRTTPPPLRTCLEAPVKGIHFCFLSEQPRPGHQSISLHAPAYPTVSQEHIQLWDVSCRVVRSHVNRNHFSTTTPSNINPQLQNLYVRLETLALAAVESQHPHVKSH